ncbi:cobalamin ABC transporter substrate-binding protein [Novosphingobium barchaimii LL02]|uniref:Cobalamin ABC transporter substrate-binding protein n=1 Tax=Novosphingobium barchaimii LL02 TaxID=1114963 RepID=A0A0J7XT45_9SPHN|nr:helical backbone metal receptor [Novosphingobium barchaimii]KMS54839.1 cobalamin ABC transporter substrate-binding protein [Novosphingobium barchaimii LL02]
MHNAQKRGSRSSCVLVLMSALALSGCGNDAPIADAGHPRIVSLNPCTDAVLAQVAAPGQLLAISHYSHDPSATSMDIAEAARFGDTSGTVEEIAALAPDVVVASSFMAPTTVQALRDMGMRVVLEPIPSDVAGSLAQVRSLAALAGNRSVGEALIDRIEAAMAKAAPAAGTRPVPALLWESGGIVAGDDTLIVDLMRRSGFANAAAARGLGQADFLPLERVLADPPRVIFTVGSPAAEEDRMLRHPALAQVKGMTRAPLDRSLLWCGGPTIPRALARLVQVRRELNIPSTASRPRS